MALANRRHTVWHYLKNFKFHSVLFRYYVLVFLLLYVPLTTIVFGITRIYSGAVRKQLHAAYSSSMTMIKDTLDYHLSEIDLLLFTLSVSESVRSFFAITELFPPGYDDAVTVINLTSELVPPPDLAASKVYVVSEQNGYVLDSAGSRSLVADSPLPDEIWDTEDRVRNDIAWHFSDDGIYASLYVATDPFTKYSGIVVVKLDTDKLRRIAQGVNASYSESFIVATADHSVVVSAIGESVTYESAPLPILNQFHKPDAEAPVIVHDTERQYAVFSASGHRDRIYYSAIDVDRYFGVVRRVNRIVILIAALLFALCVPLAFVMAVIFYNPVRNLLTIVEDAEIESNATETADRNAYNEYSYIADNITRSIEHSREVERELTRRLAMLNRAQTMALQSQINPHFLHNTLSTINWLAIGLTKGENQVSVVVNALSNMLRISMDGKQTLVTIDDEITHARMYMDIQRARYKDTFEVVWNFPDSIRNYKIVKISLQPLLENAIYHGLKPQTGTGRISVGVRDAGANLELEVADSGVGMVPAEIEELNSHLASNYAMAQEHIGLANVNQRLRLVFGPRYGVHIASNNGHGLKVKLTIPKVQ